MLLKESPHLKQCHFQSPSINLGVIPVPSAPSPFPQAGQTKDFLSPASWITPCECKVSGEIAKISCFTFSGMNLTVGATCGGSGKFSIISSSPLK